MLRCSPLLRQASCSRRLPSNLYTYQPHQWTYRARAAGIANTRLGLATRTLVTGRARPAPKRPWIIKAFGVYILVAAGFYTYVVFVDPSWAKKDEERSPLLPAPAAGADVSARYDQGAETFDEDVHFAEWLSGLLGLRKRMVRRAWGNVLEVSVGTGRNLKYYNLQECSSITFVDKSGPMLKQAVDKWKELHARPVKDTVITFRKQSTLNDIPGKPAAGYDTIIQSMGLCSTPQPVKTLAHLGTLLNPDGGRILLLEHGRGWYDWVNSVLDSAAPKHAQKFGCWYNRDILRIVQDSGLEVVKMDRPYWFNLGTIYRITLKVPSSSNASISSSG